MCVATRCCLPHHTHRPPTPHHPTPSSAQLGIAELPPAPPAEPEKDEAFLRSVHDLVLDLHINEGALVCGHCGRRYPIRKGVPHMLLKEDEL